MVQQLELTVADCGSAVKLDAEWAVVYSNPGSILYNLGNYGAATVHRERYLELVPFGEDRGGHGKHG
jgi:hypothetical protein